MYKIDEDKKERYGIKIRNCSPLNFNVPAPLVSDKKGKL
jgi:hypothetical protein